MSAVVTEEQGKARFARLLLQHPSDPMRCAAILCGSVGITDPNSVGRIAREWPHDALVQAEQARLVEDEGKEAFLPDRADLARMLWSIADSSTVHVDNRLKAAKQ